MTYRVIMHRGARMEMIAAGDWAAQHAPATALAWIERFQQTIAALGKNPQRCPLARENRRVEFELRELHFGKRPNVFRILFSIDDDAVRVLRIRRAQRRAIPGNEIRRSLLDE